MCHFGTNRGASECCPRRAGVASGVQREGPAWGPPSSDEPGARNSLKRSMCHVERTEQQVSAAPDGQVWLLESRRKGQPGGLQGGGGPPSGKRTVRAVTTKGKSKKPAFNQKAFISGGGQTRPPPPPPKSEINRRNGRKQAELI